MATGLVYPPTLPPPTQAGFGGAPDQSVTRTEFDVGVPRQRRKYRRANRMTQTTWDYSRAQYLEFVDWFKNGLVNGSRDFDIPLDGTWWTCIFVASPPYRVEVSNDEARWIVSAQLMARAGSDAETRSIDVTFAHTFKGVASVRAGAVMTHLPLALTFPGVSSVVVGTPVVSEIFTVTFGGVATLMKRTATAAAVALVDNTDGAAVTGKVIVSGAGAAVEPVTDRTFIVGVA